jgi:Raf kinase inhibitor-like YbhB/YbcL family protein
VVGRAAIDQDVRDHHGRSRRQGCVAATVRTLDRVQHSRHHDDATRRRGTGDAQHQGGGIQGVNGTKAGGYFGPRPPAGDPDHHYHFEVFALSTELPIKAGATKADLLAAMQGYVLAWGELVGTYKRAK